jgi:hypothetical protein
MEGTPYHVNVTSRATKEVARLSEHKTHERNDKLDIELTVSDGGFALHEMRSTNWIAISLLLAALKLANLTANITGLKMKTAGNLHQDLTST